MPAETHTYRDRDGNECGMADAWSTVVTRETVWNEYAQTRALALGAYEAGRCPTCGGYDVLVPLPSSTLNVRWPQHDNRLVEVQQLRCIACAAADLVRRDWHKRHEKDEHIPGKASAIDGRMFIPHELNEEVPG